MKSLDFSDFRKIVDIVKVGGHLTPEGLEEVLTIKAEMRKAKTSDPNGTKEAARNVGASHTEETKARISKTKSQGSIYIYDTFKQLLAIAPSMISLAILLGNKSISISLVRAIKEGSLYRSLCYLSRIPFKEGEKPLIEVPSPEYTAFIDRLKAKKHIRKSVFVTKDGKFLCEYEGIMAASKDLKIGHDMIKKNIVNKTTYRGYRFSYHREQD